VEKAAVVAAAAVKAVVVVAAAAALRVPEKETVAIEADAVRHEPHSPAGLRRDRPVERLAPPEVRSSLRLALVVQRYGEDVNGGAEYHCRLVAEHLARTHRVEVLTSCARDYITWRNDRAPGLERVNGIPVRRFKVRRPRDPDRFGRVSQKVFLGKHSVEEELLWLEEQGPFSPALVRHVKKREQDYDYFVFFSYRYYHSYHGIRAVPGKAILVPTAERDEVISLSIFKELFRLPRAIVYNSVEERAMIWKAAANQAVSGDVVGVGSEVPDATDPRSFREKHGIGGPYMVYVGRVDPNKGCRVLFHHFRRYREETGSSLELVLVGGAQMEIPSDPGVRYLGFLPESEKWSAIAGCDLLVIPSELESLSMVTLEAWSQGKPVLANGKCDVLRGQCRRSNAGLYYDDYYEFKEALARLEGDFELREALGANGRRYYRDHYRWEVVEGKYNRIFEKLRREDLSRPAPGRHGFLSRFFG
jgi:glycosyltransferase involved in cell wall biosynthesis